MTHRSVALFAVATVGALALAACGTTVPQVQQIEVLGNGTAAAGSGLGATTTTTGTGQAAGTPATGDGTAVAGGGGTSPAGGDTTATTGVTTPGGSTTTTTTPGGSTTGNAGGGGTTTTTTPGKSTTKTGTKTTGTATAAPTTKATAATNNSAAVIPATGQGWDAKYVYIGLNTQNDVSSAASATGLKLNPGSPPDDGDAIAADINAHGGLFGRQVKILQHDNSTAALEANMNSVAQSDCTFFTQDNHVVAVINPVSLADTDSFRSCLAQNHTPLISLSILTVDDQDFTENAPYLYAALVESYDRLAPLWVSRLQAQGYFSGWNTLTGQPGSNKVVVGVPFFNTTSGSHSASILAALLMKAGYTVKTYSLGSNADITAALTTFEQDGVTHIFDLDSTLATFAQDAAQQQYYPRFALDSFQGLDAFVAGTVSAKSLNGALGVGWFPSLDVAQAQDPGLVGPGEQACLTALKNGGQTFDGKRFAEAVGLAICDGEELIAKGAVAGGGLDPTHIRSGIVSIGTGFPVGSTFASGISASNYAVPGAARDIGFDNGCSCFTYRGNNYSL